MRQNPLEEKDRWTTESAVREDLRRQPQLMMKLAENSLIVAESLRNNYFNNTAKFVTALRRAMRESDEGKRNDQILEVSNVGDTSWNDVQGEVVTFIDGGIGQVQISNQVPILLRVGSYLVRTGERRISEREQFGYYPVIFGDLEGGSKERKDFPDIVRITAELLGGLSVLERTPTLRVLMFHGPLMYLVRTYAGHTPFTENDIDLFLRQYASDPVMAIQLKEDFLLEAKLDIYPQMTARSDEWVKRRLFEPLSWMAFLYRRLIREAKKRTPKPIIVGVVERGELREFSEKVLLQRVFRGLRLRDKEDYFNQMYGRTDLKHPEALLNKLGYTDSLLLGMLLRPGECSESWQMAKYGLREGFVTLPGDVDASRVDFSPLRPGKIGFPQVVGCYVRIRVH